VHLTPQSPRLRAAIANLLGRKYRFARDNVPGIRTALGLDEGAVQPAFRSAFNRPLGTIYAMRVARVERLHWALSSVRTRFESLTSFWTTFAFMLGASFAQSVLALPIAMTGLGPLAGLEVGGESVQVRVTSPFAMTYEGDWDDLGLCVAEIIEMAEARRELLLWMMRRGEVSLAEAAAHTGAAERAVGAVLDTIAEQGFVRKMEKRMGRAIGRNMLSGGAVTFLGRSGRRSRARQRNQRAGFFGRAGPGLPRWPAALGKPS